MNIAGIIVGLIAAILVYVVATAIIVFPHSTLVFGLLALLVFLACATGYVSTPGRRRL